MVKKRVKMVENKKILKIISILIVFFNLIFIAQASFVLNSSYIKNQYYPSEKLQGWINISFNDQNVYSYLKDSLGNKITLFELIKKLPSSSYSCSPNDCKDYYIKVDSPTNSKLISLTGEKILGFAVNGQDIEISKFSFDGSSNIGENCENALVIDIGNNGDNNFGNKKYSSQNCGNEQKSLCNNGVFGEYVNLNKVPYCEKINLKPSSATQISATLKKEQGATEYYSGLLKGWMYDKEGNLVEDCDLSSPSGIGNPSISSCVFEKHIGVSENYYLCVSYAESSSNPTGYLLNARLSGSYCGFYGDPKTTSENNGDYNINAYAKKYAALSSFSLNQSSFIGTESEDLISYLNKYIEEKYDKDCSNECIIPIKISGLNQDITINNVNLEYSSLGSAGTTTNLIYEVNKESAVFDANKIKIDLSESNFLVNEEIGNYTLKIFLEDNYLLESNISVLSGSENIILGLYPDQAPTSVLTQFSVFIDNNYNNSGLEYIWDFGDGNKLTTTNNKAKHMYNSLGNYTLEVKIYKNKQEISKKLFSINAISPIKMINKTIDEYKKNIDNTLKDIAKLDLKYQDHIKREYLSDLNELKNEIDEIETEYKILQKDSTSQDSEYVNIMQLLNEFEVPESVKEKSITKIFFIQDYENIDLEEIATMFNDYYKVGNDEEYINEISSWFIDNLKVELNHRVISIYYKDSDLDVLSEFKFIVNSDDFPVHMIIKEDVDDLILIDDDNEMIIKTGYSGIEITKEMDGKEIIFAIDGNIEALSIPVYFSPVLRNIEIQETSPEEGKKKSFWPYFLGGLLILIILALIAYILLTIWYKNKYEKHLFKNRNDLYNLLFFIRNAKLKGLSDNEIKDKLKKNKWNSEKIEYAMNKFYGRRTGMWEIPFMNFFEKKKINKEMNKRQGVKQAF